MLQRSPSAKVKKGRRRRGDDRWSQYRQRVRGGLMMPKLPGIGADEIGFLIQTHWLVEADAHDRRRVGEASSRSP
jgi:hypothetical protein